MQLRSTTKGPVFSKVCNLIENGWEGTPDDLVRTLWPEKTDGAGRLNAWSYLWDAVCHGVATVEAKGPRHGAYFSKCGKSLMADAYWDEWVRLLRLGWEKKKICSRLFDTFHPWGYHHNRLTKIFFADGSQLPVVSEAEDRPCSYDYDDDGNVVPSLETYKFYIMTDVSPRLYGGLT